MITNSLHLCQCGYIPEVYVRHTVRGEYQGEVICPECGRHTVGKHWHYDRDDAAFEAIGLWNEAHENCETHGGAAVLEEPSNLPDGSKN